MYNDTIFSKLSVSTYNHEAIKLIIQELNCYNVLSSLQKYMSCNLLGKSNEVLMIGVHVGKFTVNEQYDLLLT
jgi:hypothetical protein